MNIIFVSVLSVFGLISLCLSILANIYGIYIANIFVKAVQSVNQTHHARNFPSSTFVTNEI